MAQVQVYQIFYNEQTRNQIDPFFIPLNNSIEADAQPEWYEFGAIRNFLNTHELDDDTFYGFVSPKFTVKTGLYGEQLIELIKGLRGNPDVFMPIYGYAQICYFLNPFEQGEVFHRGITEITQRVIHHLNWNIDLSQLVSTTSTFNFSNFIFAKKEYWQIWLRYTNQFYDLVEHDNSSLGQSLRQHTSYDGSRRSVKNTTPMRTFIQERLPALIFHHHDFSVLRYEIEDFPLLTSLFKPIQTMYDYSKFRLCNLLKQEYLDTGNPKHLEAYWQIRKLIELTKPEEYSQPIKPRFSISVSHSHGQR